MTLNRLEPGQLTQAGIDFRVAFVAFSRRTPRDLAVDDRLDHAFRVGRRKRAVGEGNVPFGGPVGRGGELADVVGRAVSLPLGNSGQLAAFLLGRIDDADQAIQEGRVARLDEQNPTGLARVGRASAGSARARTTASPSKLIAQVGQVRAQQRLDLGSRAARTAGIFPRRTRPAPPEAAGGRRPDVI